MRKRYETKSCCVVDNGLFVELAVTLAPSFGKVFYYSPWESAYPRSNPLLVGQGIEGVTRSDDIFGLIPDVDLWVFPDVYQGPLQLHLESLGKRVWGSRMGEELELYRQETKAHLESLGLPIGTYVVLRGLDSLRTHLRAHDNQWVKVSRTRGDMETFHSKNYKLIEPRLDELEHGLGAKKAIIDFIVEDGIDDAIEIGYDGYTVDGQFPSAAMVGVEAKDKGYLGAFLKETAMPSQIRAINAALAETLKQYRYRNFFAAEMRVTRDGTPWIIDPCCRAGSPPNELLQVMYTNLDEIIWKGAEGTLVDPVPAGRFGAELLLHSTWADKNWQAVQFPAELRQFVKLRNLTVINGEHYVVPQALGLPEIGSVVAVADTLDEAIDTVRQRADAVEGYYIELFPDVLDDARVELEEMMQGGKS